MEENIENIYKIEDKKEEEDEIDKNEINANYINHTYKNDINQNEDNEEKENEMNQKIIINNENEKDDENEINQNIIINKYKNEEINKENKIIQNEKENENKINQNIIINEDKNEEINKENKIIKNEKEEENENEINQNIIINKDNNESDLNPNIIINENKKDKNEQQLISNNNKNDNNNINNNKSSEEKFEELQKETFQMIETTTKKRSSQGFFRGLVSKDKNRFCYDGFDLDLTYITPKIIAMGKPSTSIEGMYRNNLDDVVQFFNQRHHEHYKVYNLCEEDFYPADTFYKQGKFPFQDHEAPPLNLIHPFCVDAKKFLDLDQNNVVAIHCKAGKGRTGTFISCLLLYLNIFDNAADCLKYYGIMRVENGRGVTVPSQIRYVFYYEKILKQNISTPITFKKICIRKIRMVTVPNIASMKSGCSPTFSIENSNNSFKYWKNHKKQNYDGSESYIDFEVGENGFEVCGDVKITFYHIPVLGSKEKIFKLWFNTNFVPDDGVLIIPKDLIDKACKDKKCKKFKQNFKIEVHCIEL